MTRDDIIRMAGEAGFRAGHIEMYNSDPMPFVAPCSATDCMPELERFASLVAAAERADCAAVCKNEAKRLADSADRLESRGSNYEARQIRGLALKCLRLKDIIESRGKP